jgi:F0F1-type ATP synthase membrane subunit b/b'
MTVVFEDQPDQVPDTADLLDQLHEILENARKLPMSASVSINREEFGAILDEAIAALPEEIREARWLLKHEGQRLLEAARVRAERMVEKNELVREARRTAEEIIDDADRQGAAIRHEAEDYVDRKLAAFQVVLDRTMQQVEKGRERLQVNTTPAGPIVGDAAEDEHAFFDQDG